MKKRKLQRHNYLVMYKRLKADIRNEQKDAVKAYEDGKMQRWGRTRTRIKFRRKIFKAKLTVIRLLKMKGADYYEYFAY